jgi:NOP5NT (NUC127) domain
MWIAVDLKTSWILVTKHLSKQVVVTVTRDVTHALQKFCKEQRCTRLTICIPISLDVHLQPVIMLVLYETSLGFCLFKLTDAAKLQSADLWEEFQSPVKANKLYVLPRVHSSYRLDIMCVLLQKTKIEVVTSLHLHSNRCRGNNRDPGRKNGKRFEKILVR